MKSTPESEASLREAGAGPLSWTVRFSLGALLALSMVACSASATDEGDAGESDEPECREGQEWNGRRCVPIDDGEEDGGNTDPGEDADSGVEDADTLLPDGGLCEPNTVSCLNTTTVRRCTLDGTAFVDEPCAEGLNCADGQCVIGGTSCTPGEVQGCASLSAQRVCGSNGVDFDARACPAEAPNCRSGECTNQICEPNQTSCNGVDVVLCSADGLSQTVQETCETACSAGVCIDPCEGDGKSYVGCAFYAVDLDQFAVPCTSALDCDPNTGEQCVDGYCEDSNARDVQFAVTVSNTAATAVDVVAYSGAGTEVARATVAPGGLATVNLPAANGVDNSSLTDQSYRLEATGPVTMHQFNPATNVGAFSNDASLLLPATAVGREYIVMGWPMEDSPAFKTYVAIVAVEEGPTTVTVTPTTATIAGPGGTPAAIAAGATATFTLTRGQVLTLSSGVGQGLDLTGTEISSDRNISVFWGSECSNVPLGTRYCDHMEEQLFPVDTWGVDFVGAGLARRGRESDVWRILASTDGTLIRTVPAIPSVDNRTINRGDFLEFTYAGDFVIAATEPISVGQFMVGSNYPSRPGATCTQPIFPGGAWANCAIPPSACSGRDFEGPIGDPAMLIAVPTEQFRADYIVLTPDEYGKDYLTVVAPSGTSVTLDGTALTSPDNRVGGFDIYRRLVNDGVHVLNGSAGFGLYAYGYDCDVSYAYPGGLNLDSL